MGNILRHHYSCSVRLDVLSKCGGKGRLLRSMWRLVRFIIRAQSWWCEAVVANLSHQSYRQHYDLAASRIRR